MILLLRPEEVDGLITMKEAVDLVRQYSAKTRWICGEDAPGAR